VQERKRKGENTYFWRIIFLVDSAQPYNFYSPHSADLRFSLRGALEVLLKRAGQDPPPSKRRVFFISPELKPETNGTPDLASGTSVKPDEASASDADARSS
jgi:hypothetical protein